MTDSMKFGPEWLRNLSAEGNTTSSSGGGARYYLAEHRYGREEMLALFEQSLKLRPPAAMVNFRSLFVDQSLNPLALAPMTEDETRLWTGRTAPPGAPRGRGGSMDRGRGRGRGATFQMGFTRSSSTYDEPMRPFDRSQGDRGWSERNGDLGEWGVSSSPRKEYGTSRGAANSSDNWRKHRTDEDADGWRTTIHRGTSVQEKWSATGGRNITSNWRDGDTRDEHGHLIDRPASNRVTWHSGGDASRGPPHRRPWDVDDHLPEWATENPSESGGTFDASGAFHGSDDEAPTEKTAPPAKPNKDTSNTLQKSASQQNMLPAKKPAPLSTSQSATNLMKKIEEPPKDSSKEKSETKLPMQEKIKKEEEKVKVETKESKPNVQATVKKNDVKVTIDSNTLKNSHQVNSNGLPKQHEPSPSVNKVDDEFDHMKEVTDDIVAKLIRDDEMPKPVTATPGEQQRGASGGGGTVAQLTYTAGMQGVLGTAPTTTMAPPPGTGQDKWYYRDPQGEVQGPFTSQEMAEWFRAGYFTVSLFVRRLCDERYFTLGDLVKQCHGIPFLTCRLPPLKCIQSQPDPVTMALGKVSAEMNDPALLQRTLQMHFLQRQAEAIRTLSETEPWGTLSHLQQRELVTQHMMTQQPVLADLQYVPQMQNTQMGNPLMHMISQMQQASKNNILANKLPAQPPMLDKPPNSIPTQHLDPLQQLVQQMGGLQPNIGPNMPNIVPPQPPASAASNTAALDPNPTQQDDPIKSLLRQLANHSERDIWDVRRTQATPFGNQPTQPWLGSVASTAGMPHSMWDLHMQSTMPVIPPPIVTPTSMSLSQQAPPQAAQPTILNQAVSSQQPPSITNTDPSTTVTNEHKDQEKEQKKKAEQEKEQKQKERKEAAEKEKKRREQEQEKLRALKEAEDKRKEEHKRKEAEKKAEAERQRKEDERIRKELEKIKREAEERRLHELEERKKLKEQRKAEEEARKKVEEERKKDEEEKQRKEAERREEQARRQAEALRKMQEQQLQQRSKVAPWCQAATAATTTTNTNLGLAEIQRAEKEKRAEQTALLLQQQKAMAVAKELQEQQSLEKSSMQLKWATKNVEALKKVKSLAEIQAEEQERVAKQAAEARLAQQQKEREVAPAPAAHTSIWSTASQSLTWATNTHTTGFWDDSPTVQKSPTKPTSAAPKNNSTSQTVPQQTNSVSIKTNAKTNNKIKVKKEEHAMKFFEKNGPTNDEFICWCTKTLAQLNSDIDIPTFVGFLRDIESPYEVKEYVRQYVGETTQALQFANQFVERRCRVNDQHRAAMQYKDDLCQPAPAITPSSEFQEVKGKGKKTKKSKMMKVDSRCLGFSVTAAEDRINVGDRDYGDSI